MSCCWGSCFACLGAAFSSARGPAVPSLGNPAHVRDRRPACGIGGPRAKEGVQPYTRLAAMRASSLCGAWAFSSARGPAVPSLGNLARVRNRRPACGTGGPRAGQAARVRDRRPACERRGAALHQARCNARKLAMWSLGLLIRTWACCSESGQPRPCTGQAARVRDALESKSLLYAANPHLRLLSMGARPHRLALHPF